MSTLTHVPLKRISTPSPINKALETSRVSLIVAVLIGLVTLALFLPTLHNGFVNWDDDVNLINNPDFRGFSWSHLEWMWTNRLMAHYVPLTWMTFGLDYVLWKDEPFGYHLMNVLLHAANAAIFFLLALAIFKRAFSRIDLHGERFLIYGAAFAALFFSVHPLRVESVAWATERRDVLSGLFYLLALLVYVRAPTRGLDRSMPRSSYFWCLTFFVLSVLSKEIAVTLPLILLLLDVYPLRRLGKPSGWLKPGVRNVWLEKIPFFVISLADGSFALYTGIQGHVVGSLGLLPWTARIAITVYDMAFYLFKTILPVTLSPLYPLNPIQDFVGGNSFPIQRHRGSGGDDRMLCTAQEIPWAARGMDRMRDHIVPGGRLPASGFSDRRRPLYLSGVSRICPGGGRRRNHRTEMVRSLPSWNSSARNLHRPASFHLGLPEHETDRRLA